MRRLPEEPERREVTYKDLEKEFRNKVNELQDNCKHQKISDWVGYYWAIGHYSGYKVKMCLKCNKIIETEKPNIVYKVEMLNDKKQRKKSKLHLKGWVEEDEKKWNIQSVCPKCGGKLSRTDAIGLIGVIFVYCKDSKCRWAELYQE